MAAPRILMTLSGLYRKIGRINDAESTMREAVYLIKDLKGVGHALVAGKYGSYVLCVVW